MGTFKTTNTKIFTKLEADVSPEAAYWKKLEEPSLLKEFGPIDYIDFSSQEPYHFAVTCSVRVQVYNPVTKAVYKSLSRFRESAYGGRFRQDGKLLCAGGDEAQIKLFDVSSKNLLRVFTGHKGAVHRCFFTSDGTHLLSCSDDKSVALWDMPSETSVFQFSGFNDYVRAGAVSPASADLVLAGSYDKSVTLLDCRTQAPVFSVDHGAPVESVLFNPTGGLFISAGGTDVCIWDALAGGRLLARLTPHHKTVTCLALAGGTRLLSGGLDRRVRVMDLTSMEALHGLDFPSPILSLGVSPCDEVLAVGMVDGLVSVARRAEPEPPPRKVSRLARPWGRRLPADPAELESQEPVEADIVVPQKEREASSRTDRFLRSFRYGKALDAALTPYNQKRRPEIVVALLQELLRRKGLQPALAGRDEASLSLILRFISKYIGEFEFTPTLIDVTNVFLEVYGEQLGRLPDVARLCESLLRQLAEEERLTQSLLELQGALSMLGAAASCAESAVAAVSLEPSSSSTSSAAAVLELNIT